MSKYIQHIAVDVITYRTELLVDLAWYWYNRRRRTYMIDMVIAAHVLDLFVSDEYMEIIFIKYHHGKYKYLICHLDPTEMQIVYILHFTWITSQVLTIMLLH